MSTNKMKFELKYSNKERKSDILSKVEPVKLNLIKTFGENKKDWRNIIIFGDNFKILKNFMINKSIKGKVKLVYIDPPFSTNNKFKSGEKRVSTISSSESDVTAYEDKLVGPDYFEFLRKRLILLRELLSEDGSIYVHIDYKIGHYIKIIMDEVFGKDNFINDITRIKSNPKNFSRKAYGNIKDMILFYSKNKKKNIWNDPRHVFSDSDIKRLFPKKENDGRMYTTNPLHAPGETKNGKTGQKWRNMSPPKGRHWRCSPKELDKLDVQDIIEWSTNGVPRKKIYAEDFIKKGMKIQDIWKFKDPQYPSYPTEKNLEMLKMIISASSDPGSIVMDVFCGSGSTLFAAEEMGRKWIGVDNSKVAIKKSIKKLLNKKNIKTFDVFNATNTKLSL